MLVFYNARHMKLGQNLIWFKVTNVTIKLVTLKCDD